MDCLPECLRFGWPAKVLLLSSASLGVVISIPRGTWASKSLSRRPTAGFNGGSLGRVWPACFAHAKAPERREGRSCDARLRLQRALTDRTIVDCRAAATVAETHRRNSLQHRGPRSDGDEVENAGKAKLVHRHRLPFCEEVISIRD